MKTSNIINSLVRVGMSIALSLVPFVEANAALSITAAKNQVCPDYPVEIKATKTGAQAANYTMLKYRLDGSGSWKNSSEIPTKDVDFIVDMDASASSMEFQLVDYGSDGKEKTEKSNIVTVNLQTVGCPSSCHISSTGDYISGTDFDPKNGTGVGTTIPNGVISFFSEYGLTFDKKDATPYKISSDITQYGFQKPFLDKKDNAGTNWYYVIDKPAVGNSYPYKIWFPKNLYHGKTYRFVARLYIMPNKNCDQWSSASFIARTDHGTVTTDFIQADFYDDKTNTLLGSVTGRGTTPRIFLAKTGNRSAQDADGYLTPAQWQSRNDMVRMDVTYYGTFPNKQQEEFVFEPMFENVQCAKIAIDFISAEVESVCLEQGTICLGQSKTVNAAGFSKDANYIWEINGGGDSWTEISELRGKKEVSIRPTTVGVNKYRVRDGNKASVEFVIPVKNCAPEPPKKIEGDDKICAPNSATYEAILNDTRDKVVYKWTLKSPSGTVLATLNVDDATDDAEILKNADLLHPSSGKVTLTIPASYPDGAYKLETALFFDDIQVGNPVVKTINVYQKPKPTIELASSTICPFTENLFTVSPNKATYTYEYTTNAEKAGAANQGRIKLPNDVCSLDALSIAVRVKVTDMPTCYGDASVSNVPVNNSAPRIDCAPLGKHWSMMGYNSIELPADKKNATITLPLEERAILATCDPDPVITISASGKDVLGNTFVFATLSKKRSQYTAADLKVTIPVTADATSSNGITFTYTVKDGCGRTSDPCSQKVIVRDVTPPNVDCSKINSYDDVHLSNQLNCTAVPGYFPSELPLLEVPDLPDLNGTDEVTVTYIGRLVNPATAPEAVASAVGLFNHDIDLNKDFDAGKSYILWKFSDNAGNAKYCLQHVSVINDKKPEVTCPSHDYGNFSVNDHCELSYGELKLKLPAKELPTAIDPCPNGDFEYTTENARLFYRLKGTTAWTEITSANAGDNLFSPGKEYGNTYEFEWRYYKQGESAGVDKKVYGVCKSQFTVVDSVAPVTNCSLVKDAVVPFNSNSKEYRTFDYASYQLPDDTVHYNDKPDTTTNKTASIGTISTRIH